MGWGAGSRSPFARAVWPLPAGHCQRVPFYHGCLASSTGAQKAPAGSRLPAAPGLLGRGSGGTDLAVSGLPHRGQGRHLQWGCLPPVSGLPPRRQQADENRFPAGRPKRGRSADRRALSGARFRPGVGGSQTPKRQFFNFNTAFHRRPGTSRAQQKRFAFFESRIAGAAWIEKGSPRG